MNSPFVFILSSIMDRCCSSKTQKLINFLAANLRLQRKMSKLELQDSKIAVPAPVAYAAPQQVDYIQQTQVGYVQQAPVTCAAPLTNAAPQIMPTVASMVAVPQQNQLCDDDDPFVDINDTDEDMPVLVPVPRDDDTHVPPPDDGGGRATHTTDYADEIPSGHKPPRTVL